MGRWVLLGLFLILFCSFVGLAVAFLKRIRHMPEERSRDDRKAARKRRRLRLL
jgi:hypothetical protein